MINPSSTQLLDSREFLSLSALPSLRLTYTHSAEEYGLSLLISSHVGTFEEGLLRPK